MGSDQGKGCQQLKEFEQGKVFLGGIPWETTNEILEKHFSKYGEVVDCVIVTDRCTGNPRGFGFIVFSDPSSADKAVQGDDHIILGRSVDVKRAIPRIYQHQDPNKEQNEGLSKISSNGGGGGNNQFKTKKIFVGGLPSNITEDQFKSYFEKFGKITDVVVIYDSVTHRPRGFGFITFDSEEAVDIVMKTTKFHELNNKVVEVKRAVPRDETYKHNKNSYNNSFNKSYSPLGSNQATCYSPSGFYPVPMPMPFNSYGVGGYYTYGPNSYGGYPIGGYPTGGYPIGGYGGFGPCYPGYMHTGYHGVTVTAPNGKLNQGSEIRKVKISSPLSSVQTNGGGPLDDDSAGKENQGGVTSESRPCPVVVGNSS